jgi:peptidoglycan-associated lipoprotein
MSRSLIAAVAALFLAACAAAPKSLNPGESVLDGASAKAAPEPAPLPTKAAPEPGTCASDAQCGDGERCDAGRCVKADAACGLVRVAFAFDSAQLDESAMRALRADADCLSRRRVSALLIEGHCDERGTTEYNIALGARRADAVRRYLADFGVKATFDTVSFGKEIPLVQGNGDAAWAQNRRAELRTPGETRSDGKLVAGR